MAKSPEGGYQPTQEEIQKAEEKMTSTQKQLSDERSEANKLVEAIGAQGYVELKNESKPDPYNKGEKYDVEIMEGEINGHKINIKRDPKGQNERYRSFIGTIDGERISGDTLERIWNKYYKVAECIRGIVIELS